MAITNKFTLEKMKKKNKKSIRVNKETGEITQGGKTYKNKEDFKKREKKKPANIFEGRLAKEKKAATSSIEQGKRNKAASEKMKAAEKKYAKESMFAKARDDAKTTPGKARSFKEAFDAATKAGKVSFMLKGKSYLTTKGKRAERFPVTTDKKSAATPKKSLVGKLNEKIKSFRKKTTGYSTQAEYEEARDKRRIEKRIANIKKRKNAGKSFSAKNLKELEAKLAAN